MSVHNRIFSWNGQAALKGFERLELEAYLDQKGVPTIGYGHTGSDVHLGMTITEARANELFNKDTQWAVTCVNEHVTTELNQNQFDALVCLVFNIGATQFVSSTLLKLLNQGDTFHAALEFPKWDKITAHGQLVTDIGLYKRRIIEMNLFKS